MAEPNSNAAVSQYPAPPHFYELYRNGAAAGPPPPPPPGDDITVFGAPLSLVRSWRGGGKERGRDLWHDARGAVRDEGGSRWRAPAFLVPTVLFASSHRLTLGLLAPAFFAPPTFLCAARADRATARGRRALHDAAGRVHR